MTSSLATRQGLLTHSGNRLSAIIQEEFETINAEIGTEANKLEAAMEKFSEAVDRLDNKTQSLPEIIERIETNTTAAQSVLDNANKALARLIRLQEELEFDQEQRSLDRSIDNLFKFNYLLDVLEGDVKHFEVSGSTYQLVVEHLKEKYGNKQALIDQLLKNLPNRKSRRPGSTLRATSLYNFATDTQRGTRRQYFPAKGAACEVLGGRSEAYLAAENALEERRKLEYGSLAFSSKGAYQDRA
ncbi:hypothetical protein RB195_012205 [Necator americanus]|uniref:Uncharacterized protein n=1 Tax=Necator americanus TaxID=51031 RepID=A0ABR1D617_NECAM